MADPIVIEIDFKGVTPASGGLAVLETGWYKGNIGDIRHFADTVNGGPGRLAVYMDTIGGRVRESFDLAKGQAFILALLVSAGVVKESPDKKVKLDFARLVGRGVFFHYTAPPPSSGAGDTQYAKYRFVDSGAYEAEIKREVSKKEEAPVTKPAEAPAKAAPAGRPGAAKPAAVAPVVEATVVENTGDELDFLA